MLQIIEQWPCLPVSASTSGEFKCVLPRFEVVGGKRSGRLELELGGSGEWEENSGVKFALIVGGMDPTTNARSSFYMVSKHGAHLIVDEQPVA